LVGGIDPSVLEELRGYIRRVYEKLVPVKAIAPDLGGQGELRRALAVQEILDELGVPYRRVDAVDPRAEGGVRPNILAEVEGERRRPRLWIVAHLDTVPEGDPGLWRYPPYEASFEDDYVYGRGVEDNLQAVAEALGLVWLLRRLGEKPDVGLGLAFVSDEEVGSRYGLLYLLERGVFGKPEEEWFLVPDAGSPDGSVVLVAEKHILWVRVRLEGRQGHASMPHKALNAARLGMELNLLLDRYLHARFDAYDPLYDPPVSTFEPTRREENVQNINTIPGTDVTYWDNRILPRYSIQDVLDAFRAAAYSFSAARGVHVSVEEVAADEGAATPVDHPLVTALARSIEETRSVKPRLRGIGGGTVARYLRRRGYPAVVWMTCEETAHQPNERTRISYIVDDILTIRHMLLETLPRLAGRH
jgi:succinyl-diaminopimelate desuccinylase